MDVDVAVAVDVDVDVDEEKARAASTGAMVKEEVPQQSSLSPQHHSVELSVPSQDVSCVVDPAVYTSQSAVSNPATSQHTDPELQTSTQFASGHSGVEQRPRQYEVRVTFLPFCSSVLMFLHRPFFMHRSAVASAEAPDGFARFIAQQALSWPSSDTHRPLSGLSSLLPLG